jgi:hypothetical protein
MYTGSGGSNTNNKSSSSSGSNSSNINPTSSATIENATLPNFNNQLLFGLLSSSSFSAKPKAMFGSPTFDPDPTFVSSASVNSPTYLTDHNNIITNNRKNINDLYLLDSSPFLNKETLGSHSHSVNSKNTSNIQPMFTQSSFHMAPPEIFNLPSLPDSVTMVDSISTANIGISSYQQQKDPCFPALRYLKQKKPIKDSFINLSEKFNLSPELITSTGQMLMVGLEEDRVTNQIKEMITVHKVGSIILSARNMHGMCIL